MYGISSYSRETDKKTLVVGRTYRTTNFINIGPILYDSHRKVYLGYYRTTYLEFDRFGRNLISGEVNPDRTLWLEELI